MTLISKEPINTVSEHLRRLLHFLRGFLARLVGPNRGTRMGVQGWSAWGGPSGGVWTPQAPVLDTSAFSFRPTLKAPAVNPEGLSPVTGCDVWPRRAVRSEARRKRAQSEAWQSATEPGAHGPCAPGSTMPALLERPKLSNAMARALHRHIMMERERKRQEEEEVDKMMEQKMKEEQERRKKKEMEERMSLEETKEQILKLQEKLLALQEEKHQLFLQLKKVLHEEEKRRRKEQSDLTTLTSAAYPQSLTVHTGTHLLSMQGSPGGHNRPGTLMAADRAKQMFGPQVLTTRHYVGSAAFTGTPEHGQFQGSPGGAYGTAQPPPHYGPAQPAYSPSQQLRAPSAFPAVQYLSQPQPQPYAVHSHFQPTQTGFLQPGGALSLQKQMEHANQQTGFSDSSSLRPMHPQALHPAPGLLASPQLPVQMQPAGKSSFAATSQPGPRLPFLQHSQNPRFYHK